MSHLLSPIHIQMNLWVSSVQDCENRFASVQAELYNFANALHATPLPWNLHRFWTTFDQSPLSVARDIDFWASNFRRTIMAFESVLRGHVALLDTTAAALFDLHIHLPSLPSFLTAMKSLSQLCTEIDRSVPHSMVGVGYSDAPRAIVAPYDTRSGHDNTLLDYAAFNPEVSFQMSLPTGLSKPTRQDRPPELEIDDLDDAWS